MLKQVIRSVNNRRCSRDCKFNFSSLSPYVKFCNPGIRFVKERWTASIDSIMCLVNGDQMGELYSNMGLTYILNALVRFDESLEMKQR